MRETEQRAVAIWLPFNSHHCLGSLGCGGDPTEFHPAIAIQAGEPPIVRVARTFELGLKKESSIDLAFPQYGARGGKPTIELLGPCTEQYSRGPDRIGVVYGMWV